MQTSSLRVNPKTKSRLEKLKVHPRESYDRVIDRLIDSYHDDEPLSEEEIEGIEEALRDLKEGRVYTHEQVKKKLGLS
jgi:predicted transcriptional regulator